MDLKDKSVLITGSSRGIGAFTSKLYLIAIFFLISFNIFHYRYIFFESLDPQYLKNFFDHSQWSIPFSTRIMGDGELYRYNSYSLLHGAGPFDISPDVPPLGKYFYAFSILLFNNPKVLIVPLYLATIFIFYLISRQIFKSEKQRLLSILFLLLNPIFFSQISDTLLDLPHLFMLLLHILFMLLLIKIKKPSLLFLTSALAGLTLGFFAVIKIAIFVPVIIIIDLWFLNKQQKLKLLPLFLFTFALGYLIPYAQYFISGHSVIDFLKSTKWVLAFYAASSATRLPHSLFTTMLFKLFVFDSGWQIVNEWTIIWPLGFILLLASLFKKTIAIPQNLKFQYLKLVSFVLCFMFLTIPFRTRYVLLILPILILFTVKFLSVQKTYKTHIILAILFIQSFLYLSQQPNRLSQHLQILWDNKRYPDLYQYLNQPTQQQFDRDQFTRILRQYDRQLSLETRSTSINLSLVLPWANQFQTDLSLSNTTPIGDYTISQPLKLTKQQSGWKIVWNWDYLAPNFSPGDTIDLQINDPVFGKLTTSDDRIITLGGQKSQISVIPEKVNDPEQLFDHITSLTRVDKIQIRVQAFVESISDLPTIIGPIIKQNEKSFTAIETNPAIIIKNIPGRVYPQGLIDGNYVGKIKIIERQYPQIEPVLGGDIILVKPDKTQLLMHSDSIDGQDIFLSKSASELFGDKVLWQL